MNLINEIKDSCLPESLEWLNKPKAWSVSETGLVVETLPATDFFNDPETKSINGTAHFLFSKIKGDFDLTTRIEIDMNGIFDSGCLMIMSDSGKWAKLCYENWLNEPSIVSVVTRGMSDDCPSLRVGKVKPYLKILRSGNCFGFFYSLDAGNWTLIRFFSLDVPEEICAGLVAQCPAGSGCTVRFEFLNLELRKISSAKYVSNG